MTKKEPGATGATTYNDITTQGQLYIKSKGQDTEARAGLNAKAESLLNKALSMKIQITKRALLEGMEAAFYYNEPEELKRLHRTKEITKEEFDNNPLRKAYREYVLNIKFRFSDMAVSCAFTALTTGPKPPPYKSGLKQVLEQVERYIKQVQAETSCNLDTTVLLTGEAIGRALVVWYDLYHPKETKALRDFIKQETLTPDQIVNRFSQYFDNVYKYDQGDQIITGIVTRIFSGKQGGTISPEAGAAVKRATEGRADILKLIPGFHTILQGKATNTLARIKTRITDDAQLDLYGTAVITDKDFKLFITKYKELTAGVRPTAKLLLDALIITATESGQTDTLTRLPLREYMTMRGLKDIKETHKQAKEDIKALDSIRIELKEKRKDRPGDFLNISLSGGTNGIVKGNILFRFNQDFFGLVKSYAIMAYPKEILKINPHYNPNTSHFLRRIAEHKNMNISKANEDIISVKTLLEATPELPRYENIKAGGRIEQRIIAPFERDLDAIEAFNWEYVGRSQAQADAPLSYDEFIKLYIKVTWTNYPDQAARLEKKERQRKQYQAKKKTNKKHPFIKIQ